VERSAWVPENPTFSWDEEEIRAAGSAYKGMDEVARGVFGNIEAVKSRMPSRENSMREEMITEISGDRRKRRRYDFDLRLQYKVFRRSQICQTGTGKTINMSGVGIACEIDAVLAPGSAVELTIEWPVLLNQNCPLKLVVTGKVVRSAEKLTALRMQRYEFRTQGGRRLNALKAMTAGYHI
jgi:hypothetical protein